VRRIEGEPPQELIDPDGEGIYLLSGPRCPYPSLLHTAAWLLFSDCREWRNVLHTSVYMEPTDGDEWKVANTGRWPRYWRLNLPRRWRPVLYAYCTPKVTP
jgi:hypothetical protein